MFCALQHRVRGPLQPHDRGKGCSGSHCIAVRRDAREGAGMAGAADHAGRAVCRGRDSRSGRAPHRSGIDGETRSVRRGGKQGRCGGTLAAGIVSKSPPDGYTVFFSTIAHTIAPSLYKSLPYDFEKDLEPVTIAAKVPNILIVNPSVPAKTVGELISWIKANPGKVNFGSAGLGSTEHMSGEMFRCEPRRRHRACSL